MADRRYLKASEAERFVQVYLESLGYLVHRARRSGGQREIPFGEVTRRMWFTESHDLFGCLDLLALSREAERSVWGVQVSTMAGSPVRRRKLERVAWPEVMAISLARVEIQRDPANARRDVRWICFQDLYGAEWRPWRKVETVWELWHKRC